MHKISITYVDMIRLGGLKAVVTRYMHAAGVILWPIGKLERHDHPKIECERKREKDNNCNKILQVALKFADTNDQLNIKSMWPPLTRWIQ